MPWVAVRVQSRCTVTAASMQSWSSHNLRVGMHISRKHPSLAILLSFFCIHFIPHTYSPTYTNAQTCKNVCCYCYLLYTCKLRAKFAISPSFYLLKAHVFMPTTSGTTSKVSINVTPHRSVSIQKGNLESSNIKQLCLVFLISIQVLPNVGISKL